jgi:alpha-glucosidase
LGRKSSTRRREVVVLVPESSDIASDADNWWKEGVLYQIYPRSFRDSTGDGIGDIAGLIEKLEYLEWLGVSGIWLNPIYPSPQRDFGYDVADYCDIDPVFGNLDTFDEFLRQCHSRKIRVIMDLVPNHTSDRHPWFVESRSSRDNPKRAYYIWADPSENGGPPNNWRAAFGGSAWEFDAGTGQYYLHSFLPSQPDLCWANPEVRAEIANVMRFWFDRGVDGFRIDVVHMLAKDPELADDPPDNPFAHMLPRPEVHDYVRFMRGVADEYAGRCLVGETFLLDVEQLVSFYGGGSDELHLAFNFPFALCGWNATFMERTLRKTLELLPDTARACFMFSNHDLPRHAMRFGRDARRAAALLLLSLPGTPFLYMGEEIGMTGSLPSGWKGIDPGGRDGPRAPFRWDTSENMGFCPPDVEPWMPLSDEEPGTDVATQRSDPDSILSLYRKAIGWRNESTALRAGTYQTLLAEDKLWVYRRGEGDGSVVVILNFKPEATSLDLGKLRIDCDLKVVIASKASLEGLRLGRSEVINLPASAALWAVPATDP